MVTPADTTGLRGISGTHMISTRNLLLHGILHILRGDNDAKDAAGEPEGQYHAIGFHIEEMQIGTEVHLLHRVGIKGRPIVGQGVIVGLQVRRRARASMKHIDRRPKEIAIHIDDLEHGDEETKGNGTRIHTNIESSTARSTEGSEMYFRIGRGLIQARNVSIDPDIEPDDRQRGKEEQTHLHPRHRVGDHQLKYRSIEVLAFLEESVSQKPEDEYDAQPPMGEDPIQGGTIALQEMMIRRHRILVNRVAWVLMKIGASTARHFFACTYLARREQKGEWK